MNSPAPLPVSPVAPLVAECCKKSAVGGELLHPVIVEIRREDVALRADRDPSHGREPAVERTEDVLRERSAPLANERAVRCKALDAVGIVATYQTLDFQIDAQASYKVNTGANGFEFGDEARLDLSLQYRLWPRDLGAGTPGFLYGVLEGNFLSQGRNEITGVDDRDSGGMSFFLAPGLQYVTRRWIAEAIVQVPVVQDLNGSAPEDNFVIRAGFRVNF